MSEQRDDKAATGTVPSGAQPVVYAVIALAMLIPLVLTAIGALSEVVSRSSMLSAAERKVETLNGELAAIFGAYRENAAISAEVGPVAGAAASRLGGGDTDIQAGTRTLAEIIRDKEYQRAIYQGQIDQLRELIDVGGSNTLTTSEIVCTVQRQLHRSETGCTIPAQRESSVVGFSVVWDIFDFEHFSNSILLPLLVVVTGGIGGILFGLRSGRKTVVFHDVVLGFGGGFVAFLAMMGGKYVLIIETGTGTVTENPYGLAFAGILVGLFSEKAYQILSQLVDELGARLGAPSADKDVSPDRKPAGAGESSTT